MRVGSIDHEEVEGSFNLVLANIQSHILAPMLPSIYGVMALGAWVLFSGLLGREREKFVAEVESAGFTVKEVLAKNEWVCVVAQRVN